MSLHIEQRERNGITILELIDRLVVLHQSGTDKIALNLKEGHRNRQYRPGDAGLCAGQVAQCAWKRFDIPDCIQQEEERRASDVVTGGAC